MPRETKREKESCSRPCHPFPSQRPSGRRQLLVRIGRGSSNTLFDTLKRFAFIVRHILQPSYSSSILEV